MIRVLARPSESPSMVNVDWDDDPCPLCDRRDEEIVLEAPDPTPSPESPALRFAVVKCKSCGMIYTNPRPSPESIGQFYPVDYRPHRRPRKMRQANDRPSFWGKITGRRVPERAGTLNWIGQGRLLDFGCGGGSYLKRMADLGWQVTGLDAAVGAVREVQEKLGLRALVGSLPHPELEPKSFDVITMWHSLEHVHRPLEILREAHSLLVPGGQLIVACPNIQSWSFRNFGPSWFGLDLPRHLTHFSPDTLKSMLEASGFQVEKVRMIRHSDWLRSSAKLAVRQGTAAPWQKPLRWKPLAKMVAWLNYVRGGSDCIMEVACRP